MFTTFPKRLALSTTGLLLTTGLIVQPQSSEWSARLRDWMPPANAEVGRVAEPAVSPRVIAEGRVVQSRLDEAELRHADLRGANLHQATCRRVDLSSANLAGANCADADFAGALVEGKIVAGALGFVLHR